MTDRPAGERAAETGPYPGLRPFNDRESGIFFGRAVQRDIIVEKLEDQSVLLVHGGSGCGKSSIVFAGVLPMLEREHRRVGQSLRHASFRPSWGPYEMLAKMLAETLGARDGDFEGDVDHWATLLMDSSRIVPAIERRMDHIGTDSLCLIVDQFEEIFAWQRERPRADIERLVGFLDAVREANSDRLFVLVTMRSDFIGPCAQYPALARIVNECQYFLPALGPEEIAEAIVRPAGMFGGTVQPELLRHMLLTMTRTADPLPFVQHALKRMAGDRWRDRDTPWVLTLADLDRVSAGSNPISAHADELAAEIVTGHGADGEAALEWIFRALFDVEKSGELIRRPQTLSSLGKIAHGDAARSPYLAKCIVDRFAREGDNLLFQSPAGDDPNDRIVDVSHEAVLRQWTRISGSASADLAGAAADGASGPPAAAPPLKPSWKQQEIQDGLMWRNLAFSAQNDDIQRGRRLDAAVEFFHRAKKPAERVRRYVPAIAPDQLVETSIEYEQVETLVWASVRRRTIIRCVTIIGSLIACVAAAYYISTTYQRANNEAKMEAQAEIKNAVIEIGAEDDSEADTKKNEEVGQSTADILAQVANASLDRSGYIWIGGNDDSNPTLKSGGRWVKATDVKKGRCYTMAALIALRIGVPGSDNRSAARKGALKAGSQVCALGDPIRHSAGQTWLQVTTTTIYMHAPNIESPKIGELRKEFEAYNYKVPQVQSKPVGPAPFQVRHCSQDDAAAAQNLSTYLSRIYRPQEFVAKYIGKAIAGCKTTPLGVIELWVDADKLPEPTFDDKNARP